MVEQSTHASADAEYLIRKGGYWYRPNAQGYTCSIEQAGRYTLAEAIKYSHPNGPNGPRDGISYELAPEKPSPEHADRVERIGEIMEHGAGFWRACSGCQESNEGSVSTKDYPYNKAFRCQPGSGCRECGGIGVIWDDTDYEEYAKFCMEEPQPDHCDASPLDELLESELRALVAAQRAEIARLKAEIVKEQAAACRILVDNAVATVAAHRMRQAFRTSVSDGNGRYYLKANFPSMSEMHKADDAIRAFLETPRFMTMEERAALANSEGTA
ncbi:MAG: hypothetical protein KGJ57_17510 [Sphingomonadales bacterium]|nr:hypothetical protein [Sphingomonadales bacterium]MDE2171196.1 hypothetical protein [Sphingomonadales bacterium]